MRIVFMGTPVFALPSLARLIETEQEIVAVITQPDKPRGRGLKVSPAPVKVSAEAAGLPVYQPKSLKSPSFLELLQGLRPDLVLVVAYGKFLPDTILNLPRLDCVNVHPSLLPKYRGAAPIQWALLNGETHTGVSTISMAQEMDAGDIFLQRSIPVEPADTYVSLNAKLSRLAAQLVIETISGLAKGELKPTPQAPEEVSFAPRLKKEQGRIDWRQPASYIERQLRALNPWPSTYTHWQGRRLKILEAGIAAGENRERPGTIISIMPAGWLVSCGQGIVLITFVQPENGRIMSAHDFSLGHKLAIGTLLG
jgi:methionyl-tRNA formyltransferase